MVPCPPTSKAEIPGQRPVALPCVGPARSPALDSCGSAVPCPSLPLRQVKCYHKKYRSATRDAVFRLQFHTGSVQGYTLVLGKEELDGACSGEDGVFGPHPS